MRYNNWEVAGFEREKAVEFCNFDVNPLVSVFLASRNVPDIKAVHAVTGDKPSGFFDPFLMADMEKAVCRIKKAVETGERIAVYGDYDVDGMTASAVFALWLNSKAADYEIYIPGRINEGYGLNTAALDTLKANGVSLVVTVDCGITAIEETEHAKKIGLDLVITDHHECRDVLPEAYAVVDPKRPDCGYPCKSLAGVGVAFKLVCALENDYLSDDIFVKYSEFVAVGTVADVMPVDEENRELIRRGLSILSTSPSPGLRCLINGVNVEPGKVTASTIGFMLAPRLNAAGRMGQSDLSVRLLLTDDTLEAERLAAELCHLNSERRRLEQDIYDEAVSMLPEPVPDEPIVLSSSGWHQGVAGIVASRMAERYQLPTVIISINEDGSGHGSCRSYGSFGIYSALCTCEDILTDYGGHDKAAGITVPEENIDSLRQRITEYYHSFYSDRTDSKPGTTLELDFEVEKPELLTLENVKAMEQLEPFGHNFPSPRMCIFDADVKYIQSIGAGKHSKIKVEKAGKLFECIFFSVPADDLGVREGMPADIAFEPQINEFRGRSSVQLQLFDIRESRRN